MSVWLLIQQFAHDKVHPWVFWLLIQQFAHNKVLSMNIHFSSNKIWTNLYDFCISTEIFVFSQLLLQGRKKRELLSAYWALKVSSYNCNFCYKSTLYNFRIVCRTKKSTIIKKDWLQQVLLVGSEDDIVFSFCLFSSS
jgi:hypothetical protein